MEKKTIEVSANVFEKVTQDKGKCTWDQQLERMYKMAYGTDYVRSPKLQDFNGGDPGGAVGKVRVPSDGDLEFFLRFFDGTPTAIAHFDELAPDEEVAVEVPQGEVVEGYVEPRTISVSAFKYLYPRSATSKYSA